MNPVVTVTINPDGTAREVNFRGDKPINPENHRGSTFYLAYVQMQKDWHITERALRTFEIENVCNNCNGAGWYEGYSDSSGPYQTQCGTCYATGREFFEPGTTHTAEILETYPEIRGNVHGRVRIMS